MSLDQLNRERGVEGVQQCSNALLLHAVPHVHCHDANRFCCFVFVVLVLFLFLTLFFMFTAMMSTGCWYLLFKFLLLFLALFLILTAMVLTCSAFIDDSMIDDDLHLLVEV